MTEVLRHRHANRFTVLPNDAIRNPSLSFRAVGVLAHLLSLPDGAKVDSATLATAHSEGRDAVRSAFKELADHGYYRREVRRLANGTFRTEVVVSSIPMDPAEGNGAGRTEDGFPGVGPEPENPAPVEPAPVNPTSAGPPPVDQAAEEVPTTKELFPPQPPRRAGGQDDSRPPKASLPGPAAKRAGGTNLRALGANPRAEAEQAEASRLEAEAGARRAELERTTEARRAAERAAGLETERLEAEAVAISACLDDAMLAGVVDAVRGTMAGPLAASAMAVARAVVAWCRTAAASQPGGFADVVVAGLAAGLTVGEGTAAPPLDLPAAPPGTASLRSRVAALLIRPGGFG
jgi:hypothetical protein